MANSKSTRVAILGGIRTPFAKAGTVFAHLSALDLAIHAVNGLLERYQVDDAAIDEIIFGTVAANPAIPHLAREIVLQSDLDPSIRALSVGSNCVTGISAIETASARISTGHADLVIAGGTESMSNPPVALGPEATKALHSLVSESRNRARLKILEELDFNSLLTSAGGLREPSTGLSMGEHTELSIKDWHISRENQDLLAYTSHMNARKATEDGRLLAEIAPIDGIECDQQIRSDTSKEQLASLPPVFDRSSSGSITAGNASPLTDGSASILLASEAYAEQIGFPPVCFIKDIEFAAIDPAEGLLMAPALAVPRLLARNELRLSDIEILEMHEAFAGQVLANIKAWETAWKAAATGPVDHAILNPLGSSIAVGHPLAATGVRIITTLANEMKRRDARYGLASVCAAGGLASAVLLEKP